MSMLSAPYNRLYERVKQLEYANGLLRNSEQRKMERIEQLESLVRFMEPFFKSAVSHECGCPEGYFEPHGCDDGCKALKELDERMAALRLGVDE